VWNNYYSVQIDNVAYIREIKADFNEPVEIKVAIRNDIFFLMFYCLYNKTHFMKRVGSGVALHRRR
jgi:hypothetical protein